MNRDELRSRGREIPPALLATSDTAWIGPIDSDADGTWIGTNEYGLTACLLNAYFPIGAMPEAIQRGARSRGVIIPELLANQSLRQAESWIHTELVPTQFAGFMLLVVAAESCVHYLWPGEGDLQRVPHNDEWTCLTSSFIDSSDAESWRYSSFQSWLDRGAICDFGLPRFHMQRDAGKESLSPLMERSYSVTRSITQVLADIDMIDVRYWSEPHPKTDVAQPTSSLSFPRVQYTGARKTSADDGGC
jgi:hypothetical protein